MTKINTLNEKIKGLINLKICRYNPKIAVCKYFYDTLKGIEDMIMVHNRIGGTLVS